MLRPGVFLWIAGTACRNMSCQPPRPQFGQGVLIKTTGQAAAMSFIVSTRGGSQTVRTRYSTFAHGSRRFSIGHASQYPNSGLLGLPPVVHIRVALHELSLVIDGTPYGQRRLNRDADRPRPGDRPAVCDQSVAQASVVPHCHARLSIVPAAPSRLLRWISFPVPTLLRHRSGQPLRDV